MTSSFEETQLRNHLRTCTHFKHLFGLLSMFNDTPDEEEMASLRAFSIQSIQEEVKILDNDSNWNQLLYKEALKIDRKDPSLNRGLKASRQLRLFKWWRHIYLTSVNITMEDITMLFNGSHTMIWYSLRNSPWPWFKNKIEILETLYSLVNLTMNLLGRSNLHHFLIK